MTRGPSGATVAGRRRLWVRRRDRVAALQLRPRRRPSRAPFFLQQFSKNLRNICVAVPEQACSRANGTYPGWRSDCYTDLGKGRHPLNLHQGYLVTQRGRVLVGMQ